MICALLIFQTPDLPDPLADLSPWLDWLIAPREDVYAKLAEQSHRRFIKSHTPLDGIPEDARATYLVTGRHPLDMAVSLYHQGDNIDRQRLRQLTGQPEPEGSPRPRKPVHEWLLGWIEQDSDPREEPDSLPGIMWHLSGAWARRNERNVELVHYADLSQDLEGQMKRLANLLEIAVDAETWPTLVKAATFEQMRSRFENVAPDPSGVLKDKGAFFRRGTSGAGRELLTREEVDRYHSRAAELAPADLLEWLNRPQA